MKSFRHGTKWYEMVRFLKKARLSHTHFPATAEQRRHALESRRNEVIDHLREARSTPVGLTQRLECHPHTVEVTGSNLVPPNDLRQPAARFCMSPAAFGRPGIPTERGERYLDSPRLGLARHRSLNGPARP
jgi:hypothetical protein